MLATIASNFEAVPLLATIGLKHTAVTLLATITCLTLILLTVLPSIIKGAQPQPDHLKKQRKSAPASWHKPPHRSRKQKHKVYIAPVIKRKWRTPRRSSY